LAVRPTGGWDQWIEVSAPLQEGTPGKDREDVYLVFVNPGQSGLMNLDWIQFNPR